jgi:hypothetical protein
LKTIHVYEQFIPKDTKKLSASFDVDLVLKRIEEFTKSGEITIPTLVEAKRFELINVDLITKNVKIGRPQWASINRDILKLKLLRDVYKEKEITIKGERFKSFRTCILVWGLSTPNFNINKDFIQKLTLKKYISRNDICIRYLPISWTNKMKVTRMLWVGIFEVI